jgi:hypothetical protein
MPGEETRIDLDQVTAFFGKFPETAPSEVPQLLGTKMINVFEDAAAALRDLCHVCARDGDGGSCSYADSVKGAVR